MIGIDIEKNSRFENWTEEGFKRVFSEKEIEYCNRFENKEEHYCGFFCVKEAFVKALDDDGINFTQIEVLHEESGKPYINVTPYIQSILHEHFVSRIQVSISHTAEYSTAVVLVE